MIMVGGSKEIAQPLLPIFDALGEACALGEFWGVGWGGFGGGREGKGGEKTKLYIHKLPITRAPRHHIGSSSQ